MHSTAKRFIWALDIFLHLIVEDRAQSLYKCCAKICSQPLREQIDNLEMVSGCCWSIFAPANPRIASTIRGILPFSEGQIHINSRDTCEV